MKILVIGGTGVIGQAITKTLGATHEVITAGKNSGDLRCNIDSEASLHELFRKAGSLDAVIIAAGGGSFKPVGTLSANDFEQTMRIKLMGQVKTVLIGQKYLTSAGSFTLTSGILSERPVKESSILALINGGLESFVKAASLDMLQRINCVSPTLIEESVSSIGYLFPGTPTVSAAEAAKFYKHSVEGSETGKIYRAWGTSASIEK